METEEDDSLMMASKPGEKAGRSSNKTGTRESPSGTDREGGEDEELMADDGSIPGDKAERTSINTGSRESPSEMNKSRDGGEKLKADRASLDEKESGTGEEESRPKSNGCASPTLDIGEEYGREKGRKSGSDSGMRGEEDTEDEGISGHGVAGRGRKKGEDSVN